MGQLKPNSESHTYFFTYSYEKKFKSGQQGSTFPSYLEGAQRRAAQRRCCQTSALPGEMLSGGFCTAPSVTGSPQPEYRQTRVVNPLEANGLYECCELIFLLLCIHNPHVSESS